MKRRGEAAPLAHQDGLLVQTMRDTTAFGPGEFRACIGCHESRSEAPPHSSRSSADALEGPPAKLEPEIGPASLSFPRDIQPILNRHCLPCHDASDPAARVILSGDATPFFSLAYETLTRSSSSANNQNWGGSLEGSGDERPALAPAIHYVSACAE